MPTVLRLDHLRVVIYPNDHRPAHVHIVGGGCEAVVNLQCPNGPPELRENSGFSRQELTSIKAALAAALVVACKQWSIIHGQP